MMPDLSLQADEAAVRSRTLAAASAIADAARPTRSGQNPDDAKVPKADPSPGNRDGAGDTAQARGPEARKDPAGPEGNAATRETGVGDTRGREALWQTPARAIGYALRVPKQTGEVRESNHSGEIDVWHLLSHLGRAAKEIGRFGATGIKTGGVETKSGPTAESGLMSGLRAGYKAGKGETPAETVAAAALRETDKPPAPRKPTTRAAREGGMDR